MLIFLFVLRMTLMGLNRLESRNYWIGNGMRIFQCEISSSGTPQWVRKSDTFLSYLHCPRHLLVNCIWVILVWNYARWKLKVMVLVRSGWVIFQWLGAWLRSLDAMAMGKGGADILDCYGFILRILGVGVRNLRAV